MVLADRHGHLGQQAAVFDREHAADQLIATADLAKVSAARLNVSALEVFGDQAVDLAFRYTVMAARCLRGLNFIPVDPLLQRRVADSQNVGRFPRRQQLLHVCTSSRQQDSASRAASSIRFYTLLYEPNARNHDPVNSAGEN